MGWGVCKHVEAVLLLLETRHKRLFRAAQAGGSAGPEVIVDHAADALRVLHGQGERPRAGRAQSKNGAGAGQHRLAEEARAALLETMLELGQALAVERRLPEPPKLEDALQPPVSHGWGEALPMLRGFLKESAARWKPVAEWLAVLAAAM